MKRVNKITSRSGGPISRGASRAYTIMELMMALAIFSVGITGIAAMKTVTATANGLAKDISVATALARSWQDRLSIDATNWGGKRKNGTSTRRHGWS